MILNSIRTRLTLVVGLSVGIMLSAVWTFGAVSLRQAAVESAQNQYLEASRQYAAGINSQVNVALGVSQTLAQTFSCFNLSENSARIGRNATNEVIQKILEENPQFLGLRTVWEPDGFDGMDALYQGSDGHTANGRFSPFWHRDSLGRFQLENVPIDTQNPLCPYAVIKNTHACFVTSPHFRHLGNQYGRYYTAAAPIVHNGMFRGVVGVVVDVKTIQSLLLKAKESDPHAQFYVLDQNGDIVAGSANTGALKQNISELQWHREMDWITNPSEPHYRFFDEDSLNTLIPIEFAGVDAKWTFLARIPSREIMKKAQSEHGDHARNRSWTGFSNHIFVYIAATKITKPIKILNDIVKDVSKGKSDHHFPIGGHDEIAELASNFSRMIEEKNLATQEILDAKQELEFSNQQLESLVESANQLAVEAELANMAKGQFLANMSHEIRTPHERRYRHGRVAHGNRTERRAKGVCRKNQFQRPGSASGYQ